MEEVKSNKFFWMYSVQNMIRNEEQTTFKRAWIHFFTEAGDYQNPLGSDLITGFSK